MSFGERMGKITRGLDPLSPLDEKVLRSAKRQFPRISGEVNGDCIYVYEEEEKPALETLRHEFLDYAISQAIEPYKEIANRLILMMNDGAYRRKEKLVEALSQLMNE